MAPRRSAAEERAQVADRRLQRERVVLRSGVAAARTETTATPAPSCNRPAAFLSAAEEVETLLPGLECTPPGVGRCGAHLRGRRSQGRSRGGEQRLQGLGVDPREHRLARDRRSRCQSRQSRRSRRSRGGEQRLQGLSPATAVRTASRTRWFRVQAEW
jgi:hypothetical protein